MVRPARMCNKQGAPTFGWRCSDRREWRDCVACQGDAIRNKLTLERDGGEVNDAAKCQGQ